MIREKLRNLDIHYTHPSYFLEKKLLREIRMGLRHDAIETLSSINALERPNLARDSLRSVKNSLIASCTLFTRAVIASGVDTEDAFDLSDVFIKEIESYDNEHELKHFEYAMVEEFIKLNQTSTHNKYPYPISKVVRTIYELITTKLTVASLASGVNLSPDYLSKLFHKEVGIPIGDFIQIQKIDTAKYFLEFTDMKITEISTLLEYCNPGHFTNTFKKYEDMTPVEYRKSFTMIKEDKE